MWTMYDLAWRDDRKITWDDWPELSKGTAALGILWAPEILTITGVSTTPLVIVEGVVVTGAIVSYAVGGVEGVENYIDFITEPEKYYARSKFTVKTIYEQKIEEPLQEAAIWYVETVDDWIAKWELAWAVSSPW